MLATLYSPSLDPIDTESMFAAGVVLMLTALTSLFPSRWVRERTVLFAPMALLALSLGTEGSPLSPVSYGRSFPDLSDYVAAILYLAFGFGFALVSLRGASRAFFAVGAVFSIIFGASATLFAVELLTPNGVGSFGAAGAFILLWLPVMRAIRDHATLAERRAARNQCVYCGYDLRGSVGSGRCPECGITLSAAGPRDTSGRLSGRSS